MLLIISAIIAVASCDPNFGDHDPAKPSVRFTLSEIDEMAEQMEAGDYVYVSFSDGSERLAFYKNEWDSVMISNWKCVRSEQ